MEQENTKKHIVDQIIRFGSVNAVAPWFSNGGSYDCQVKEKPEPHGYSARKPKSCPQNCNFCTECPILLKRCKFL